MKYLSIPAWQQDSPVYLAELILALGSSARNLLWQLRSLDVAPNTGSNKLAEANQSNKMLTTLDLLHIITPDVQIIDGEIIGYQNIAAGSPHILFRAVDSTTWDIEITDGSDFHALSAAFPESSEIDPKHFE